MMRDGFSAFNAPSAAALDAGLRRFIANPVSFNPNQHGLTGPWYNPASSGQGIVLEVLPDLYGAGHGLFFGGWFTFDASATGERRWYSLQGQIDATNPTSSLAIYSSEGGNLDAPPAVGVTQVGTASIEFNDCAHATFEYAFSGTDTRNGSISLDRLGPSVACSISGTPADDEVSSLLSGTWYDPQTSGQGFVFDLNAAQGNFFAAWYTYKQDGQNTGGPASQDWFSLQGALGSNLADVHHLSIFETTGGRFDDPAATVTTAVGTAQLSFSDCNTALLSYGFTAGRNGGKSGNIYLSRPSPAPATCQIP
jgi:hypothetical protein